MTVQAPNFPKYSPGVLSMLPLFYVGWADSVLSPSEVKLINKKVKKLAFLSKEDLKTLKEWNDPKNPPSPELFKHWVKLLKEGANGMESDKRISLVELGLEMAKKSAIGDEAQLNWNDESTKDALNEIQNAIGIASIENYRNIFSVEQRNTEQAEVFDKPSFEIAKMTALLDDKYGEIRNKMRTLLSDPEFAHQTHILRYKEDFRDKVMEWTKFLADQGLGAISYPVEYGGKDSMGEYAAVFEMLGYHDNSLSIKFGVQFGLFGGSVLWLGTKKHHDKYLKDIGTLAIPGCFAMTETGHGSNVRGLQTTATYDSDKKEFIINTPTHQDGKEYIGNALHSKMASVFAQLIVNGENHGVHAILVPLRNADHELLPGVKVEDNGYKLGLNGVDNGRIWFDNVRVPRENLLNKFGDVDEKGIYTSPIENPSRRFFTMLGTLVGGRVCVPRAGLSAAKLGLTIAIKHGLKRRQFAPKDGEPETLLLDYPSHQYRLMPRLAKAYALDFALTYLTERYVDRSEEDIREIETLAAGLKSYATWFTTSTLQECREACGGKGYLHENRFADLKADTDIFTTFEGDNTVLMQLVGKGLLSNFQKEFHDEGYWAVLRHIQSELSANVFERNPVTMRNTDSEHLLDSAFYMNAFKYRERRLVYTLATRIRGLIKKQIKSYDAFLRVQNHVLDAALAYVERVVLEQFVLAVEKCEDPACQKALKTMCDLYALNTIEEHKGWYLESDYMTGTKTKSIRKMVTKLCKDVRINADCLVDSFGIPSTLIAAPIAL